MLINNLPNPLQNNFKWVLDNITKEDDKQFLTVAKWIECGIIHSQIPTCCVAFWIEVFMKKNDDFKYRYSNLKGSLKFNYVPCPRCLIRIILGVEKPIIPKPCNCALTKDYIDYFKRKAREVRNNASVKKRNQRLNRSSRSSMDATRR